MVPVVKARIRNRLILEHGLGHLVLDPHEQSEHADAAEDPGEHPRVGPTGGVPAVGQQGVDDAGQDGDEADREGGVAEPVDLGRDPHAVVLQLQVGPHRPEQTEGHRDQEHETPLDRGQHPTEDEADKRAADGGHAVDPHGHAPLVLREGIGEDGARVGEKERAPDPLEHPHDDDPHGTGRSR